MALKLTNNATGLLASNISSADTTVALASSAGSKFPSLTSGDWFPVVVVNGSGGLEVMRCTARTGDVLTVTRGQEGTTAMSFTAGARVDLRLTSAALATFALQASVDDALDLKADIDGPDFTGAPTAPTPASDDDSTRLATTAWVRDVIPVEVGMVFDYDGTTLPARYIWANGAAVSRTTYAAYFAKVGTRHGAGNGTTTFNVRDMRGRVGVGKDDMGGAAAAGRVTTAGSGIDGATIGATGGAQAVAITEAQLPSVTATGTAASAGAHTHGYGGTAFVTGGGGAGVIISSGTTAGTTGSSGAHDHTVSVEFGGDEAHNNMPPAVVVNYIIYVGV